VSRQDDERTPPRAAPEAEGSGAGDDGRSPRPPSAPARPAAPRTQPPGEIGGPKGPEPTRYGDWERGGRCTDF
jgi:hypothetical protein